jgi:hypothetical protein
MMTIVNTFIVINRETRFGIFLSGMGTFGTSGFLVAPFYFVDMNPEVSKRFHFVSSPPFCFGRTPQADLGYIELTLARP